LFAYPSTNFIVLYRWEKMIPEDKDYGSKNPGGTWSGTVGIVATRHAHLGLNMFAFSTERMEVVDFLNPIFAFR